LDLKALFSPRSVAVIGAAPQGQGLRGKLLQILRSQPYAGAIYPVSRSHAEVQGLRAYPSVADIPDKVDLALIIIPAALVPAELRRCGEAGVKAAVVLSSGFSEEPGESGTRLQAELRSIAAQYDMAVLGPNSEGFANCDASLAATFSAVVEASAVPLLPQGRTGRAAVIAQSGGLGFAFYDRGRPLEIPFGAVVATGNEASLESCDIIDYLLDEGRTDVFLLLVEAFKDPAKLRRVAAKALRGGKPIIVVKIGRSEAGQRAAASHTGSLAGRHSGFEAVAARYGLIEARDIDEANALAQGFLAAGATLPQGRRVVICTASGGGGGLMADSCWAVGLDIPELDAATRKAIDAHLPSYGTSQNPVDATAQAVRVIGYARLAELALASPQVDMAVVVMSVRSAETLVARRDELVALKRSATKPIFLWTYTLPCRESTEILAEAGYPLYTDVRHCARSVAALAQYRRTREAFLKRTEARAAANPRRGEVARTLAAGGMLSEVEATPLLAAYGIDGLPAGLARTPEEALAVWRRIGGPVALKVQSPDIPHKTEAGAVVLGINGREPLLQAYDRVLGNVHANAPAARVLGVLVQAMAGPGREMIVGVTSESMGPLLMLGLGGVHAEVLKDRVFAPLPLTAEDARHMAQSLRGAALLGPYRGAPPVDVEALCRLMVALSEFAIDHADAIESIDLNPVIVHERGVSVADALIVARHLD
jgi:acyl-CoA synthetase (NDP forming)